MRDGDARRFLECVSSDFRDRRKLNPQNELEFAEWSEQLREEMQMFRNFRIVERKDLSPEKVVLGLQSSEGPTVLQMPLQLDGNEWRVDPLFEPATARNPNCRDQPQAARSSGCGAKGCRSGVSLMKRRIAGADVLSGGSM